MVRLFLLLAAWLASSQALAAITLDCATRKDPGIPNDPPCQPGFPSVLVELGHDYVVHSSPTVADVNGDGSPEILFGTHGGRIVVAKADGKLLWSYKTGDVPIQSKPAVADLDGDGQPEVIVTAGDAGTLNGGLYILEHNGQLRCSFTNLDPEHPQGMYSSPAIGRFDPGHPGQSQIALGSFDFRFRVFRPDCSVWWEYGTYEYVVDTIWSSAAVADMDRDGWPDIVIGTDSNQQTPIPGGITLPNGGLVRILRGDGSGDLPGFPKLYDEVIYSSPAVGDIRGNGEFGMVVGTGRCWDIPGCIPSPHTVTKQIIGLRANGQELPGWPVLTPNQSSRAASPALAKFKGVNGLVTVLNTMLNDDVTGRVHAIKPDGTELPGWPLQPSIVADCSGGSLHWGTEASPVIANVLGLPDPQIISAAANEFIIWNRAGQQLTASASKPDSCAIPDGKLSLWSGSGSFSNSPAVADLDGDGRLEIIGASNHSAVPGYAGTYVALYAWTFPQSSARPENRPWPEFRHDRFNSGFHDVILQHGFETF